MAQQKQRRTKQQPQDARAMVFTDAVTELLAIAQESALVLGGAGSKLEELRIEALHREGEGTAEEAVLNELRDLYGTKLAAATRKVSDLLAGAPEIRLVPGKVVS